jgi:hypothetical protein
MHCSTLVKMFHDLSVKRMSHLPALCCFPGILFLPWPGYSCSIWSITFANIATLLVHNCTCNEQALVPLVPCCNDCVSRGLALKYGSSGWLCLGCMSFGRLILQLFNFLHTEGERDVTVLFTTLTTAVKLFLYFHCYLMITNYITELSDEPNTKLISIKV